MRRALEQLRKSFDCRRQRNAFIHCAVEKPWLNVNPNVVEMQALA